MQLRKLCTLAPSRSAGESMNIPKAPLKQLQISAASMRLLAVLLLALLGANTGAADATNALASTTNAAVAAATTNAPAPAQQPDSTGTLANNGNEQDLTWPIPAATTANLGLTNP